VQTFRSRALSVDVSALTFHAQLENRRWMENCLIWLTLGMLLALPIAVRGQQSPTANKPSAPETIKNRAAAVANYGNLPLSFEANEGQTDPQVRFLSRGDGYSLFLTDSAAVLSLSKTNSKRETRKGVALSGTERPASDVVRMELAGVNHGPRVAGDDKLPGIANYFIGSDPSKWHRNVPTFSKVRYSNVFPGVDLVYYGNQHELEYDFIVAPGADTKPIRLHFAGAKSLRLDANGDLHVVARNGEVAFHKPVIYQTEDAQRRAVNGHFTLLAKNTVGFALGRYDHNYPLVIDPTLIYSSYLGGNGGNAGNFDDNSHGIAVDAAGSAYVVGGTWSTNFPITNGSYDTNDPGNVYPDFTTSVGYVSKFNATGTGLDYSTYIGGSGSSGYNGDYVNGGGGDGVLAIAVDKEGNAYLTGSTWSSNFPVTQGAIQNQNKAFPYGYSAFVAKLDSTGSNLLYSTYLGGTGLQDGTTNGYGDYGAGIAINAGGNAYVAGSARSKDFPVTAGVVQGVNKSAANNESNAWVAEINPTGTALVYSTYLGGSGSPLYTQFIDLDTATGIAIDSAGDAYLTGFTISTDFPITSGAFQTVNKAAAENLTTGYVTELNPKGTALVYSTYVGGSGGIGVPDGYALNFGDTPLAIALDSTNHAYITGNTGSSDFPVTGGAFQTKDNGAAKKRWNGFITKLNPTGTALVYSTYLGGSGTNSGGGDFGNSIAVDALGNAYVDGYAYSVDFPITANALQPKNAGAAGQFANAFVTEINPAGSALVYSSYLGGSGGSDGDGDGATGIALDPSGDVYVFGTAYSSNFPVTAGAFQTTNKGASGGNANLFVTKINLSGTTTGVAASIAVVSGSAQTTPFGSEFANPLVVIVRDAGGNPVSGAMVSFSGSGLDFSSGTITTSSNGEASVTAIAKAVGSLTASASVSGVSTSAAFTLTGTSLGTAATPIFSPAAGTYTMQLSVTIADATSGTTIYYTTNGTAPTASSTKYTGAISVSSTETLEAIATAPGYTNSAIASATYTFKPFLAGSLQFVPVTPCRIVDTRNPTGAFGGPELAGSATRTFDVPKSSCGIPTAAVAYSLNVTVVPVASLGYLTIWPAGQTQPVVSTLNSDGRVKANATITPAGTNGGVNVFASDATQFILDIDGYFVPQGTNTSGLQFFPLAPCRVSDTRNADGPLGGPSLASASGRAFPIQSSGCGVPSTAKAYSLNVTAVPHGSLGFLTAWPTGETQPVVSTLNASTGAVTANAAIVPAGTSGDVSIYVSDASDVILDVNGYFAPPATGGLSLYTVTPCRALDTRSGAKDFDGTQAVPIHTSACAPPAAARAYVLNATVVPATSLGFLSLWADGEAQPVVSTLNANDGAVTSNMAIVPNTNGSIDAFASDSTNLILDISSYFAP
jgi:hypothetical protein